MPAVSEFLRFSDKITCIPVIHGSGDFAVEVRRIMLAQEFDCLAVPLPPTFQEPVEAAIEHLPSISVVVQKSQPDFGVTEWTPDRDLLEDDEEPDDHREASYVPIDPCQPVIAALRIALGEHIPRRFVDLETRSFLSLSAGLPDPYALKKVPADRFAASVLPALSRLPGEQSRARIAWMANRLRELEAKFQSIAFVCSVTEWPWVREAYREHHPLVLEHDEVEDAEVFTADPQTLLFLLGELPFITALYERARSELDNDENLSVDGLKELLLATRTAYKEDLKQRARSVPPKLLSTYFKYVRNLALVERRLTPDLYSLIVAGQQTLGDQFAVHLAQTARDYAIETGEPKWPIFRMGDGQGRELPYGEVMEMINRLPGQALTWRSLQLKPQPPKIQQEEWQQRWNPFRQCSWPPEDSAIERFRTAVKDAALAVMGGDLARTEKFQTSLKDGLDIRETLRNWHTGELYVKVLPPNVGHLDCVVMLFDSPADPRDYPWRITWYAEHHDESTLALFATDFRDQVIGPGVALATYGGGLFLFPPRPIPDIWSDPRLDFTDTLEERLLAAGCLHSEQPHIALLSPGPPGPGWRMLARRFKKKFVHVPLSRFSQQTIQQLRMFHVLNGHEVRSYAAHFIRKA